MTTTHYPDTLTLGEARKLYFRDNGFGEDGGYEAPWIDIKIGPVPVPLFNSPARKRAVPIHDLHHLTTGYGTDWTGEAEISAWELGAGCRDMLVAWQFNLSTTFLGVFFAPRRTFRAFVRGRRSRSFYDRPDASLVSIPLSEARALARLPTSEPRATPTDAALFAASVGGGAITTTLSLLIFLPLAPFGVLAGLLAKRRALARPN